MPKRDPNVDLVDMLQAKIATLMAEREQMQATILRLTEQLASAGEERGRTIAAEARAMAAERLLAAETKRADDESEECDKYEAECERLRQALIAEVEARAKAEAAAVAKGKVVAPPAPPPAAPQKPIRYDMIRNEVGDIVSIITKPED